MSSVNRIELEKFLSDLLQVGEFSDYGPNGLQIEGSNEITKAAFAVSATKESVAKAVEWGTQALIVHHGLFWHFHGVRTITGPFAARVAPLVKGNINLFSYHLPLDAHPQIGNAAGIATRLQLKNLSPYGSTKRGPPPGIWGELPAPLSPPELEKKLESILAHKIVASVPSENSSINSVAIITGGANSDWVHCLEHGIDSYITGEMSEHDWHEAKESGVSMFAGGHHATERFGVLSLKELIENKFSVKTIFIDSDNPA